MVGDENIMRCSINIHFVYLHFIHLHFVFCCILGNGPSAIILSYFLSGYWPYYNGKPIDDPILKERLRYVSQKKSLVLQVNRKFQVVYFCSRLNG